jgi:hypothetical protein
MPRNDFFQTIRDPIECAVPADALKRAVGPAQHRVQQSPFLAERLAERRSLRADAGEICGMAGISGNRCAARAVAPHDQSAADPAIGAGGAHLGPRWRGSSHNRSLLMITRVVMAGLVTASRIYPDLRRFVLRNSGKPELRAIHVFGAARLSRCGYPRRAPA